MSPLWMSVRYRFNLARQTVLYPVQRGEQLSAEQNGSLANDEIYTLAVVPTVTANNETEERSIGQNCDGAAAHVQDGAEETEDRTRYLKTFPLALLTLGLCLCALTISLDNTILATAVPKVTTVFDSLNDVGWYFSSYLLTQTTLQPTFGKIYTYFNVKWTFLSGIAVFEIGSVVCAAATSSKMLIVGRAAAGIGAAALFSGGMNIVSIIVPLRKRAIYIAALSSMAAIASVTGPILGGVLTDRLSWRWCFWINLPLGAISFTAVLFTLKDTQNEFQRMTFKKRLAEIDILGAILLIGGIASLLLALQRGGITYKWSDPRVWPLMAAFGASMPIFCVVQWKRGERATIPPRLLLRQRTILASSFFTCFLAMASFIHVYYLPFYFQAVRAASAESSGLRILPYLAGNTIASIVISICITKFGWYTPFMWVGSTVFVIGSGLLYTLKADSNTAQWLGYQVLTGIGFGSCVQIPFLAVQVVLKKKDMPSGLAIIIFFNLLGGTISVSIAQNIFSHTLSQQLPIYAPSLNASAIIAAGAAGLREVTPPHMLVNVREAYNIAITKAFILPIAAGAIGFCFSFMVEWGSVKGKNLLAGTA